MEARKATAAAVISGDLSLSWSIQQAISKAKLNPIKKRPDSWKILV